MGRSAVFNPLSDRVDLNCISNLAIVFRDMPSDVDTAPLYLEGE